MREKVVVTGINTLTNLGMGINSIINSLDNCRLDTNNFPSGKLEKEIGYIFRCKDDYFKEKIPLNEIRKIDRFTAMVIATVDQILSENVYDEYTGFILNTEFASWSSVNDYIQTLEYKGPNYISPRLFSKIVQNYAQGKISILYQLKGPSTTLTGNSSVAYGFDLIQSKFTDQLIVSGVEEINEDLIFAINKVEKCKYAGEGAGTLLIESENSAIKRDTYIYAEILDYKIKFYSNIKTVDERKLFIVEMIKDLLKKNNINYPPSVVIYGEGYMDENNLEINEVLNIIFEKEVNSTKIYYPQRIIGETFGAAHSIYCSIACEMLSNTIEKNCRSYAIACNVEFSGNIILFLLKSYVS
ncbi:beta-ketoacyl synthase N-terminal-like domain-containing protein [Heyndrickxia sp. NPDC080065]|uniref:beta-ketoacyl synthase N-terminal-like domain-containing protein n=1 Tax=Heyndrickxia sp. NPDC080065 TaxID=3390568 RepID=UPI003D05AC8A